MLDPTITDFNIMTNFYLTLKSTSSDNRMKCEDLTAVFNTMMMGVMLNIKLDCEQQALHMVKYKLPEYYRGV